MDTFEDGSAASFDGQKILETLKSLKKYTNWELVDERRKFIHQVYPLIKKCVRPSPLLPNVQDVFSSEDVERLAIDCINFEHEVEFEDFMFFLINTGYKDEPKLDGDGKPSSRRTTPVHIAAEKNEFVCSYLFDIYNRYDVNYTDESGLSHFHVACMNGYINHVKKFLELGQDPNCLWLETGDSPLHSVLWGNKEFYQDPNSIWLVTEDSPLYLLFPEDELDEHEQSVELLLRNGADLNLANKEGLTPLHIISKKNFTGLRKVPQGSKILFEISDELNLPLPIDARDKFGNTPLHLAVLNNSVYVTQMLLRRGANPNLANDEGSTPLHLFYMRRDYYDTGLMELFFKICDEVNQTVQVDVVDKLGRTPLQLAVANLCPDCIDILFEHGADLCKFVFPSDYFATKISKSRPSSITFNCRLRIASGALAVVERIENRGYQLKRSDALTIMKCFTEYKLFENSADLHQFWYDNVVFIQDARSIKIRPGISHVQSYRDDEERTYKTGREIRGSPSLPLNEIVLLQPEEAAKLFTYEDYWKFACSSHLSFLEDKYQELSALNLCEKLSKGFFRSWALDPFMELIHDRLPVLSCEMIIEQLSNEDLCNICLAATGKNS